MNCEECGSSLIRDDSSLVCPSCGLVIRERMIDYKSLNDFSYTSDFVNHNNNNDDLAIGVTSDLMIGKGLGSFIDVEKYKGTHPFFKVVKFLNFGEERRISEIRRELIVVGKSINLSYSLIGEAMRLCRKYLSTGSDFRGRNLVIFACSFLFISCRNNEFPIVREDFEDFIGSEKGNMHSTLTFILRRMNLKLKRANPLAYYIRFANLFFENKENLMVSSKFFIKLYNKGKGFPGKSLIGIIAGFIYYYFKFFDKKNKYTQQEVSKKFKTITEVTLRSRVKEFKKITETWCVMT